MKMKKGWRVDSLIFGTYRIAQIIPIFRKIDIVYITDKKEIVREPVTCIGLIEYIKIADEGREVLTDVIYLRLSHQGGYIPEEATGFLGFEYESKQQDWLTTLNIKKEVENGQ